MHPLGCVRRFPSACPCRVRHIRLHRPARCPVLFCWRGFPLAKPLPSAPSARGLRRSTGLSDFSRPFIIGVWTSPRPAAPSVAGGHEISRFSREVFPHMHGVSDRAGSHRISRYRCVGCSLPPTSTASAPQRELLSRLSTRPARTPVNASPLPSRATTHDSGPLWAANPSTYDSFIHYTSPVYPGARRNQHV